MKKRIVLILSFCLLLWGCNGPAPEPTEPSVAEEKIQTVGVCVPDFDWSERVTQLRTDLEAAGCQVLIEYAMGDLQQQKAQVQTFVNMPVSCLVVAAMDPLALNETFSQAKQMGVPVIAWERLPLYTDAVTGYVSVDGYQAGQLTAQYIIEQKQLETAKKPVRIEFFMDVAEDPNARQFHQGVMALLQPYLDSGILLCRSGRTSFEDTCVYDGDEGALECCFDYLAEFYIEDAPDVLCTATDALARGCVDALDSFGMEEEQWPLITGVGGDAQTAERLLEGFQSMCLYTDPLAVAKTCAQWVLAALEGKPLLDQTCDNGAAQVPCSLQIPEIVDAQTCKDRLPMEETEPS